MRFSRADNVQKGGIEQIVVHRLRVDQEQPLGIRVDAVLERQIHQHRAGNHRISLMRREGMLNVAALGIHDQQKELFGHSQHGCTTSREIHLRTKWAVGCGPR